MRGDPGFVRDGLHDDRRAAALNRRQGTGQRLTLLAFDVELDQGHGAVGWNEVVDRGTQ